MSQVLASGANGPTQYLTQIICHMDLIDVASLPNDVIENTVRSYL